jgi:DNA topoisomerase-3
MNLSRAATLTAGELLSVGRVQTPTLAILVERELAIRRFVPEDYLEVVASFAPMDWEAASEAGGGGTVPYRGTWFRGEKPTPEARRLPKDGDEARAVVDRARRGDAVVESVAEETRRLPPPLLYDLTELQRHANRLYGLSARQTLAAAQALYERHKVITYPRTDSRHLSRDVASTLPAVVGAVAAPYRAQLAPGTGDRPLGRRFVDDTKVTDHHAIIPTSVDANGARMILSADESRVYDLVCRRLLMAWHEEHVFAVTTVITRIDTREAEPPLHDRYHSSGTAVQQVGWKALDPPPDRAPARPGTPEPESAQELPPGLAPGQPRVVADVEAVSKRTRPPRRFTDATLLTAMESAGEALDDRELSEAMKDRGLGTPATRAEIIETLLRREYAERQGKALAATDKGIRLIERIHPDVKSPALTGQWEAELARIQRGQARLPEFMRRIEDFVRALVARTLESGKPEDRRPTSGATGPAPAAAPPHSPITPSREGDRVRDAERHAEDDARAGSIPGAPGVEGLADLLQGTFRLPSFRPYQEAVCRAVTAGEDVLLVMPTGAGKSLCYQLPGRARGGTTLVVSPLIALMEDQVAKLRALGLRASRIHSGRDRAESREVGQDYLAGRLDFLFVAPERLRVPGFAEMLAGRKPSLVAIDEAHCISEWGHDFRPDYRLLGERLPALRPAPVIALTATATPRVQDDIAAQLGLARGHRFIHGFRRTNIAIEAAQLKMGAERAAAVRAVLSDAARRPAIVYAPTRKEADALATELLGAGQRAAAYHAGMNTQARDRVQAAFLSGELEVIVATIAFGMGVDKPDVRTVVHTGLPGSLEGYYQEIGRAGRDGHSSRAVLLYSFADRRTHDFFLERDYPEPEALDKVFRALTREPRPIADLQGRLSLGPDALAAALDKLWVHGGARVEGDRASLGSAGWRAPYVRQREHKRGQIDEMMRWAESHGCRMLSLVRHFGDQQDRGEPCGQCDVCAPAQCVVRRHRPPTAQETTVIRRIAEALLRRDGQGAAQLHRESGTEDLLDRRGFERLLGGLARADLVKVTRDTFEKEGRTIAFQRVSLTGAARRGGFAELRGVAITDDAPSRSAGPRTKRSRGTRAAAAPAGRAVARTTAARHKPGSGREADSGHPLVPALKAWRLAEARRQGVPAFRIFTDRTLVALVRLRPASSGELLAVPGLGPRLVARYGDRLLSLLGVRS